MPTREELEGLLARVEKATGPDRDIDWEIGSVIDQDHMRATLRAWEDQEIVRYSRIPGRPLAAIDTASGERRITSITPPSYSYSMDDAIGLFGRILPEHHWRAGHGLGMQAVAHVNLAGVEEKGVTGFAALPPLALLSALLRAMLAASEGKG